MRRITPILILTVFCGWRVHDGVAFLQKPFAPTVLAATVRQLLDSGPGDRERARGG